MVFDKAASQPQHQEKELSKCCLNSEIRIGTALKSVTYSETISLFKLLLFIINQLLNIRHRGIKYRQE